MKKTFTLYLTAEYSEHAEGNIRYQLLDYETTSYPIVASFKYEVELPPLEVVSNSVITKLKAKQADMRAVSAAAITEIDNQVASLLALENLNEA